MITWPWSLTAHHVNSRGTGAWPRSLTVALLLLLTFSGALHELECLYCGEIGISMAENQSTLEEGCRMRQKNSEEVTERSKPIDITENPLRNFVFVQSFKMVIGWNFCHFRTWLCSWSGTSMTQLYAVLYLPDKVAQIGSAYVRLILCLACWFRTVHYSVIGPLQNPLTHWRIFSERFWTVWTGVGSIHWWV